jgi:hypothetical protein
MHCTVTGCAGAGERSFFYSQRRSLCVSITIRQGARYLSHAALAASGSGCACLCRSSAGIRSRQHIRAMAFSRFCIGLQSGQGGLLPAWSGHGRTVCAGSFVCRIAGLNGCGEGRMDMGMPVRNRGGEASAARCAKSAERCLFRWPSASGSHLRQCSFAHKKRACNCRPFEKVPDQEFCSAVSCL